MKRGIPNDLLHIFSDPKDLNAQSDSAIPPTNTIPRSAEKSSSDSKKSETKEQPAVQTATDKITSSPAGSNTRIMAFTELADGEHTVNGKTFTKSGSAFTLDGKTLNAKEIEKATRTLTEKIKAKPKAEEKPSDQSEKSEKSDDKAKFSLIGEKGAARMENAEILLDNLRIAREMTAKGKDAKTVKLATGWEKGKDGKWKMEIPDLEVKRIFNFDSEPYYHGFLKNVILTSDLFKAYPELEGYFFALSEIPGGAKAYFSEETKTIVFNRAYTDEVYERIKNGENRQALENALYKTLEESLIHEVQHAIQKIEGFAKGGSMDTDVSESQDPVLQRHIDKANELITEKEKLEKQLKELKKSPEANEKQISSVKHRIARIEELLDTNRINAESATSPQSTYKRLAGEVEARNAVTRSKMSMDERRQSLLDETADVAEEDRIYLMESVGEEDLAVGDKFAQIKDTLLPEEGKTPLFTEKYNSVTSILPKLAEIFNNFPNNITAADGVTVLVKNPDNGKISERLKHLISQKDNNSGERNTFGIDDKIPWLPRIVETLENAQVKLKDPQTGNYAYVRAYKEGVIHTVIVSKNNVIQGQETFDHGLITQFAERFAGRRNSFEVVWERNASKQKSSPQTASHMESSGKFPRPFRQGKYTSDSSKVKPTSAKNPEKSSNGAAFSTVGDLETEQKSKKQKSSTPAKSSGGISHSFSDYRGLPDDEQSLASAALQSVKHSYNVAPKDAIIKNAIKKIAQLVDEIRDGKHLSAKSLITTLHVAGFQRSHEGGSAYLDINELSTARLSNHPATASTFVTVGENSNNISLVLRSAITGKKEFEADDNVNLLELQFGRKHLDKNKLPILLADIAHFLATGEYIDNVGAVKIDTSGSGKFKLKALEKLYNHYLKQNNIQSAEKAVKEAAKQAGYITIAYHGTNAEFYVFDNGSKFRIAGVDKNGKLITQTIKDEGFFFSALKSDAEDHANGAAEIAGGSPRTLAAYLKLGKPLIVEMDKFYAEKKGYNTQDWYDKNTAEILDEFHKGDYDSIWVKNPVRPTKDNLYIVFESEQIKSADPVTYDDNGNIIPLSERFNPEKNDIRYSLTSDLGDTSLSPIDYRRSIAPLFDFVMEYTDNGVVNPGREHEGEYFTGSFISSEFVAYSEKKPQGRKQSDAQYQQYLARRERALNTAEGTPLDEIAAAYVRKFGGDEKDIAEQILDMLRDLTRRDLISDRAEAKREVAEHEKEQRKEDKAEYAKMKDAELTKQVNELFESKEPVTVDKRWVHGKSGVSIIITTSGEKLPAFFYA